jgi:hypothetical protein
MLKNTKEARLMHVLAKLVRFSIKEALASDFLGGILTVPISSYRANYDVSLTGRKWLAPLYRPTVGTVKVRAGTFVTVREGKRSADVEIGSDTYTVKIQDWREKSPYFLHIPNNRFRGKLSAVVKQIYEARRLRGK